MSNSGKTLNINILDRSYSIGCPPGEEEALQATGQYVHNAMINIKNSGRIFGAERVAVMAAINIAHSYLKLKKVQTQGTDTSLQTEQHNELLQSLNDKLDQILLQQKSS